MDATHDIFISYRREGGEHLAGRVKYALVTRGFSVFMDVEDLKSGRFDEALLQKIQGATDVLVILTPGCLERCRNEDDWFRREIRHAITCNRNIVPILARGFQMSTAPALPGDIAQLAKYHGLTPAHELFEASIDRLVATFLKARPARTTSTPPESQTLRTGQRRILADDVAEYQKKAASGDAEAQFQLANCYAVGTHVPQSDSKAVELYLMAAGQGYPDAQFRLGLCSYSLKISTTASRFDGQTLAKLGLRDSGRITDSATDPNYVKAAAWFRKAAEQGHAEAQFWVGLCHDSAIGVAKDLREATTWYRRAAEQGLASAQEKLGFSYQYGKGVDQDLAEAVYWYELAARQGDQDAQYALGCCYHDGDGVAEDWDKAIEWFRLAAAQGSPDANQALEEMGAA
jgi:TPR repeat protein